jgi:hypothetical protein
VEEPFSMHTNQKRSRKNEKVLLTPIDLSSNAPLLQAYSAELNISAAALLMPFFQMHMLRHGTADAEERPKARPKETGYR